MISDLQAFASSGILLLFIPFPIRTLQIERRGVHAPAAHGPEEFAKEAA